MNVSRLPSFKEIIEANKPVWRKHRFNLLFWAVLTYVLWVFDVLLNWSILGLIPTHWVPELFFLAGLGYFLADFEKSWVPTWLIVVFTYLATVYFGYAIGGYSAASLTFSALINAPFPLCFFEVKINVWKEALWKSR